MGLLDKANNRSHYPVVLSDRTVYVRALTIWEARRMGELDVNLRTPFVIGCALVKDDGKPEVAKEANETDEAFSARVEGLMRDADVDTEVLSKITQAIGKIGKVDVENIPKN